MNILKKTLHERFIFDDLIVINLTNTEKVLFFTNLKGRAPKVKTPKNVFPERRRYKDHLSVYKMIMTCCNPWQSFYTNLPLRLQTDYLTDTMISKCDYAETKKLFPVARTCKDNEESFLKKKELLAEYAAKNDFIFKIHHAECHESRQLAVAARAIFPKHMICRGRHKLAETHMKPITQKFKPIVLLLTKKIFNNDNNIIVNCMYTKEGIIQPLFKAQETSNQVQGQTQKSPTTRFDIHFKETDIRRQVCFFINSVHYASAGEWSCTLIQQGCNKMETLFYNFRSFLDDVQMALRELRSKSKKLAPENRRNKNSREFKLVVPTSFAGLSWGDFGLPILHDFVSLVSGVDAPIPDDEPIYMPMIWTKCFNKRFINMNSIRKIESSYQMKFCSPHITLQSMVSFRATMRYCFQHGITFTSSIFPGALSQHIKRENKTRKDQERAVRKIGQVLKTPLGKIREITCVFQNIPSTQFYYDNGTLTLSRTVSAKYLYWVLLVIVRDMDMLVPNKGRKSRTIPSWYTTTEEKPNVVFVNMSFTDLLSVQRPIKDRPQEPCWVSASDQIGTVNQNVLRLMQIIEQDTEFAQLWARAEQIAREKNNICYVDLETQYLQAKVQKNQDGWFVDRDSHYCEMHREIWMKQAWSL